MVSFEVLIDSNSCLETGISRVSEFSFSETNEDSVQDYIDENSSNPNPVKATELYNSYKSYCFKNELPQLSMNSFCKGLIKKGYEPIKKNDGNYYNISVEGGR